MIDRNFKKLLAVFRYLLGNSMEQSVDMATKTRITKARSVTIFSPLYASKARCKISKKQLIRCQY